MRILGRMLGPLVAAAVLLGVVASATAHSIHGSRPSGGMTLTPELWGEGLISTPLDELNAVFSPDGKELYWSVQLGDQSGVIVMSRLTGAKWSEPQVASFSGRYTDWDPFFSPDGNRMFYVSNRPKATADAASPRNLNDFDIWVVTRTASGGWSEPENLGAPVNTPRPEYYPSISSDGTLYFSGLRGDPQTGGGFDIYRARLVDGKYGEPENLGPEINARSAEIDNYIAPDQSFIIFNSSGRPDDLGRGDLYISFNREGKWTPAVHLPEGINSSAREYCPIGSPDGKWLYFTSKRGPLEARATTPLTYKDVKRLPGQMMNGGGNIYRVRLSELLDLARDR